MMNCLFVYAENPLASTLTTIHFKIPHRHVFVISIQDSNQRWTGANPASSSKRKSLALSVASTGKQLPLLGGMHRGVGEVATDTPTLATSISSHSQNLQQRHSAIINSDSDSN
jgi:hypothetical protein